MEHHACSTLATRRRAKLTALRGPGPQGVCFSPDNRIRISRIVAKNDSLLADGDGDFSDFIELTNTGLVPIDITTWLISDGSNTWPLTAGTTIGAGESMIIFASGKGDVLDENFPGPTGELHTNFKLSSDGEDVSFAEASGCIVDQAKNDSTRSDEDGDFGDWIEIRNTTGVPLDIGGWIIADDGDSWIVPEGVELGIDGDVVVWADEKDRGGPDCCTAHELQTQWRRRIGVDCFLVGLSGRPSDLSGARRRSGLRIRRRWCVRRFRAPQAPDDEEEPEPVAGDIEVVGTCIAITEVMAKNDTTIEDCRRRVRRLD
ncbi:hypothetical protein GQR58_029351 [Nymphon striatum]|nr:hypothetical protein GQR58_029351 [Nymphon striatum]